MALVGYRDLAWLKSRILPADMSEETTWDSELTDIGLGVAALFDSHTGRTLRRTVGHIYQTPADLEEVTVDLYPIETITAAELIVDGAASDISASIINTLPHAGIIFFAGQVSHSRDLLRLTLTGGFWCQDGDEAAPSGAQPIPADLLNAWVSQVRAVCAAENILRAKAAEKPDAKAAILSAGLTEDVRKTLQLYMRF